MTFNDAIPFFMLQVTAVTMFPRQQLVKLLECLAIKSNLNNITQIFQITISNQSILNNKYLLSKKTFSLLYNCFTNTLVDLCALTSTSEERNNKTIQPFLLFNLLTQIYLYIFVSLFLHMWCVYCIVIYLKQYICIYMCILIIFIL